MKTQCIIFTALFLLLAAPAHAAELRAHVGDSKDWARLYSPLFGPETTSTKDTQVPVADPATGSASDTAALSTTTGSTTAPAPLATSTRGASASVGTNPPAPTSPTGTGASGNGTPTAHPAAVGAPQNIYTLSHALSPQMTLALLGVAAALALLGISLTQARTAPRMRRVWG